jgi:phosphatidate cytidylyltransferase
VSDWADRHADNLLVRTASGLVLIAVGLGAAMAGGPWLAAATGAAVTAMSFEWARMSEPRAAMTAWGVGLVGVFGAVLAASWAAPGAAFIWLAAAAIASALRRKTWPERAETAFGIFYIGAPCTAFLWLRAEPDVGLEAILALFTIIWSADIAAYLGGRFIGGPRIAPSLSPRKTWAGVWSGTLAAAVAGGAVGTALGVPLGAWIAAGAVLGLIGLAGDLFESLCKRRFGVKDASNLIPGHGGVLDRLDGMMAATAAAGAAAALFPTGFRALLGTG